MQAVPYYVKAMAMGIPTYLIGVHLWSWLLMSPFYLGGHSDFRQLYTGGYMIRSGHARELYSFPAEKKFEDSVVSPQDDSQPLPINHPAYVELVFAALSFFRYKTAYWTFLGLNLALLALTYVMLRPWLNNLAAVFRWLPAALFPAFLPVAFALLQGQDSVLFLTLASGSFVMLEREREFLAGILIGAGLFRPQIALPIAFLFLAWRQWRFVSGFILSAAAAALVSVWIIGLSQVSNYIRMLFLMGASSYRHGYPLVVQRMANLHGVIFGVVGSWLSPAVVSELSVFASIAWLAWFSLRYRFRGSNAMLLAISVAAAGSYHTFMHDMSVLLVPIVIVLDRTVFAEGSTPSAERNLFRAASLLFVSQLCMSYATDHFYLVAIPLVAFCIYFVAASVPSETDAPSIAGPGSRFLNSV